MSFLASQGIKALCLDIDGTLYSKRMLNWRMFRSSFPSLRLGLYFNAVRKEYREVQEIEPTIPASRKGLLARQASLVLKRYGMQDTPANQAKIAKRIDKQFYKAWERSFLSIKPHAKMREALVMARQEGMVIAVFSDFPLADKLKTLGIDDLVDIALSAEDSGYLKPSKKAFAYLLDHVQVQPNEILYVGDSYSKDCKGSKQSGMYSCLLSSSKKVYTDADLVVGSWKEFISLVL
ncbi:MAG: HAD family hydrolase [Spirochaetia bacterium]|nr:HAD family hydrolase [Sphaerochaeta sp.]NCC65016.1 HAD family hydrolase [Spirochaetia bacterium]